MKLNGEVEKRGASEVRVRGCGSMEEKRRSAEKMRETRCNGGSVRRRIERETGGRITWGGCRVGPKMSVF